MIRLVQRKLIIPRGDTGTFSVPVLSSYNSGDKAVFSIIDPRTHRRVYSQLMDVTNSVISVRFEHGDTVNLPVGKYLWDIKFYQDPIIDEGQIIGGREVDSYYAAFTLPECEVRPTGDNMLMADDSPGSTLTPQQINAINAALLALSEAVAKTESNVSHYPTIIDGEWNVWDANLGDYATTGIEATGNGIASIEKTNTQGLVDTYTVNFTDGNSFSFTVTNGDSGVYYGTTSPTNPNVNVWINPDGASWDATIKPQILADLSFNRVTSLNSTSLASNSVIEAIGTPTYITDFSPYGAYNLTLSGWYVFARIQAPEGKKVGANTTITGAAGYIATLNNSYVDVAVRFDVAAESQTVTVVWDDTPDIFVFKATDLAVRNLDYRTTFYVYDIAPYTTWEYALTTDTKFVSGKRYFVQSNDNTYTEVIEGSDWVADGDIAENTYYNHKNVTFSGMARNVTYKCDEIIDCPQIYVLPEIEDDTHGCWYEIRLRHNGSYSSTLQVPDGVKVATEHTQAETAGLNMVDLHYSNVGGVKLWRFLNTHSTIPS